MMQWARNSDSVQKFMSSFRVFERKLDRLQEDVRFHGNTLMELRVLVANLATSLNTDRPPESRKTLRHSAVQYDTNTKPSHARTRHETRSEADALKKKSSSSAKENKKGSKELKSAKTESNIKEKKQSTKPMTKHSLTYKIHKKFDKKAKRAMSRTEGNKKK